MISSIYQSNNADHYIETNNVFYKITDSKAPIHRLQLIKRLPKDLLEMKIDSLVSQHSFNKALVQIKSGDFSFMLNIPRHILEQFDQSITCENIKLLLNQPIEVKAYKYKKSNKTTTLIIDGMKLDCVNTQMIKHGITDSYPLHDSNIEQLLSCPVDITEIKVEFDKITITVDGFSYTLIKVYNDLLIYTLGMYPESILSTNVNDFMQDYIQKAKLIEINRLVTNV